MDIHDLVYDVETYSTIKDMHCEYIVSYRIAS